MSEFMSVEDVNASIKVLVMDMPYGYVWRQYYGVKYVDIGRYVWYSLSLRKDIP